MVQKFPEAFGTDYQANKDKLNTLAVVHSKMRRNKIAGYITKMNGKAAERKKRKRSSSRPSKKWQLRVEESISS